MKPPACDRPTDSPEIEYLLAHVCPPPAAKTELPAPQRFQPCPLDPQTLDWPRLLQHAAQQGVLLRLYQALQPEAIRTIPPEIQQSLQATAQALTFRNWQLTKVLIQLLDSFAEAEIPAIPFKGPTFTHMIYGDLAHREFVDLDILVPASKAETVSKHLANQGYQARHNNPWSSVFAKPESPEIDLHWQVAPPCFSHLLNVPALLQRCQSVDIFNHPVLTLTPADAVIIASVQIAKDCHFNRIRLVQLCDFAALIQRSDLDGRDVLQRAAEQSTVRLLYFALRLTQVVCQMPLPAALSLPPDAIATQYAQHIAAGLFTASKNQEGVFGLLEGGFRSKLYGNLLRGLLLRQPGLFTAKDWALLQHFVDYMLTPNARDSAAFQQAGAVKMPVHLARPLRLVGKFFKYSGSWSGG